MALYEFRLDDNTGAVYINYEDKNKISIDYRYESYTNDVDWKGHYRCEVVNENITEELLDLNTNYNNVKLVIELALKNMEEALISEVIRNSYLNKKVKLQRF